MGKLRSAVRGATGQVTKDMDKMNRDLVRMGKVAAVAIAGIGLASVVTAAKFGESMSKIVGLVGVSREQVDAWKKDLQRIGPETGRSMNELADALFFIASAGLKGSDAIEVLEASAKASAAGLGEVKTIADLVTSAVNAYGKEALSAMEATDILTAAVREGKAESTEFAGAMGEVLPLASNLQVSFGEVAGAIAAMSRTGTNAAQATTQLNAIFQGLIKPSKEAESTLKDMGTSAAQLRKTIREEGLLTALDQIRLLTNKYGEETAAKVFPNIRALKGILDLLGKSYESNVEIMEATTNASGATEKAYAAQEKEATKLWNQTKAKLNVALERLGSTLLPVIIESSENAGSSFDGFVASIKRFDDVAGITKGLKDLNDELSRMPVIGKLLENVDWAGIRKSIEVQANPLSQMSFWINRISDDMVKLGLSTPAVNDNIKKTGDSSEIASRQVAGLGFAMMGFGDETEEADKQINKPDGGTGGLPPKLDKSSKAAKTLADDIDSLQQELSKLGKSDEEILEIEAALKLASGESAELVEKWKALKIELANQSEAVEAIEDLESILEDSKRQLEEIGATIPELRELRLIALEAQIPWDSLNEDQLKRTKELLEQIKQVQIDTDLKETAQAAGNVFKTLEEEFGLLPEKAKEGLNAMEVFASDIASNINTAFADTFESLIFDVENLGDVWKNVLRGMARSFFELISTIATNPIRIALSGGGGGLVPGGSGGLDIGSGIGALFGGIGESFRSLGSLALGEFAGFTGFVGTLGAALPAIGLIAGAVAGIASLISSLLKKKPRLDIDFDKFRDESGKAIEGIEGIATLGDFLNDELADQIIGISVKRKAGLGVGGDDAIKELIKDRIQDTIEGIQAVLEKLPSDLFESLNQALLNATFDTQTIISGGGKGERFLEFDAEGKNIAEKFQTFIEKELPAKVFGAIRESFFDPALQSLGVSAESTQELIDNFLEDLSNAGSREARGEVGEAFLLQFNAFIDAFNFAEGRFGDSAGEAIDSLRRLSDELGFKSIPSINEMKEKMAELIENAEIDPDTVDKMKALKQGIEDLGSSLAATNLSLIQFIDSLNSKIVQLGGTAFETSGALNDTINSLMSLVQGGGLSFQGSFSALQQIEQAVGLLMQQELAATQQAVDAQNALIQAQNEAIQEQIEGYQEQISLVQERGREEIDALEDVLSVLERFRDLAEDIRQDLRNLFTGSNSILNPFEKVNFIQGEIGAAAQLLANASTDEERLEAIDAVRNLQNQLISLGNTSFGVSSPEFQALFSQVADELQGLADLAEEEGAKVESVQDRIKALQDSIEKEVQNLQQSINISQGQLQDIGSQQVQIGAEAADRLREILEFARDEAKKLLEQSNEALKELGVDTSLLNPIEAINAEQLIELRAIRDSLSNIIPAASGFQGMITRPQLFLAGERGPEFVNITPERNLAGGFETRSTRELNVNIDLSGNSTSETKRSFAKELAIQMRKYLTEGEGYEIVRSIK